MQLMKKVAAHICAVVKGMLFTGFSVQIILGVSWMCCNFNRVQDFGEPDSALYRWFWGLFGGRAAPMYLVQLTMAGLAGYCFLREWRRTVSGKPSGKKKERMFDLWKVLVLLTFPFAMQCHLAILPYSFMASLFLLSLLFLCRAFGTGRRNFCAEKAEEEKASGGGGGKYFGRYFGAALLCMGAALALSGALDADKRRDGIGDSLEAVMARRIAWPTLWNDFEEWPEELREFAGSVVWEASYYPGNMDKLQTFIESRVDAETAKKYYRQMTEVAWECHASDVIKQIVWDMLGYAVTPIVFRLQLEGRAYDSCTGRNYEVMRGNTPVLTRYYVDYGCWWFGWSLALSAVLIAVRLCPVKGAGGKRRILPTVLCACLSFLWIALLTARGAGIMDYKYTIAVNELWLTGELLLMGGFENEKSGPVG